MNSKYLSMFMILLLTIPFLGVVADFTLNAQEDDGSIIIEEPIEETPTGTDVEPSGDDTGSDINPEFYQQAISAMEAFKKMSYVLTVVGVILATFIFLPKAKEKIAKNESDTALFIGFNIAGVIICVAISWLLYFTNTLGQTQMIKIALKSGDINLQLIIQKIYSLGIGPFYIAHTLDIAFIFILCFGTVLKLWKIFGN